MMCAFPLGLVRKGGETDYKRHAPHGLGPPPLERRMVGWISPQDEKHIHGSPTHSLREVRHF